MFDFYGPNTWRIAEKGFRASIAEFGLTGGKTHPNCSGCEDWRECYLMATVLELVSRIPECVVRKDQCFLRVIGQSRSKAVDGRIIMSEQTIKARAFRSHRLFQ
jgi:hypothetical protein